MGSAWDLQVPQPLQSSSIFREGAVSAFQAITDYLPCSSFSRINETA